MWSQLRRLIRRISIYPIARRRFPRAAPRWRRPIVETCEDRLLLANMPPSGTDNTVTTLEDTAYVFKTADFGFSDSQDVPANNLLRVIVTSLPASGTIDYQAQSLQAPQLPFAVAASAISQLTFTPSPDRNETNTPPLAMTFRVQDDGGTASEGSDVSVADNTATIRVLAVNDAPSGTNDTVTLLEDQAHAFRASDFGFADAIDLPAMDSFVAVKITTLPLVGSLTFSGAPVRAGDLISVGSVNQLKYSPLPNGNGATYARFTFQVLDDGGTANGGIDLDPTPKTLTLNVTPVNDPPSGQNATLSRTPGIPTTFSLSDFGYADPSDKPHDPLLAVKIASLPTIGQLLVNGNLVQPGQVIAASDIASGLFQYSPIPSIPFTPSFTFQVQDTGGTANGGLDLDPTPKTLTIIPSEVDHAPLGRNNGITTPEDTAYEFLATDFPFTDIDANNFRAIKLTALPATGVLQFGGSPATVGQFVSYYDFSLGRLTYLPPLNANGPSLAAFTFQVQDDGDDGIVNGLPGLNLDPTPRTLTINVTPVNDPPQASIVDHYYYYSPLVFDLATFGFSDPADSPSNLLAAVKITTVPTHGSLTDRGSPVSSGQLIPVGDILAGLLKYDAAYPYDPETLAFQVQDDGGTGNGGVDLDPVVRSTTLVRVACLGCLPEPWNTRVSLLEDHSYTFSPTDFALLTPAVGGEITSVRITSLPANGWLDYYRGVTIGTVIPISDIAAGRFKYVPAANQSFSATFGVQVLNSAGWYPTTNSFGFGLQVVPVNDPPRGWDRELTALEDTPYTFSMYDFGFSDDLDPSGQKLLAVRISSLPTSGTLTLSGTPVQVGQYINVGDLYLGHLQYGARPNAAGLRQASFTYQVQDSGGTANGGVDLDPTPDTVTLNVTPVNDSPQGADKTLLIGQICGYTPPLTISTADFGFSDPLDLPANMLARVNLTFNGDGMLRLNGTPVPGGVATWVSRGDLDAGHLVYEYGGTATTNVATITFQVQDDGGTENGGVDIDPVPRHITFSLAPPLARPPIGVNPTVTDREDVSYAFRTSDFPFSDVCGGNLKGIIVKSVPSQGQLSDGGVPVAAGQTISLIDMVVGNFRYLPAANASGSPYTTLVFQNVSDELVSVGGVSQLLIDPTLWTLTINVTPVNDPPRGYDISFYARPCRIDNLTLAAFAFSDPSDSPPDSPLAVKISTLPDAGRLYDDGVPVTAGQYVSSLDILDGELTYDPLQLSYSERTAFTFQVQDSGGTANGGSDLDPVARTMTLGVLSYPGAFNDSFSTSITAFEDQAYAFALADFPTNQTLLAENLLGVVIEQLPAAGVLRDAGSQVAVGQFVPVSDIIAQKLTYTPPPNSSGFMLDGLVVLDRDDGGGCDLPYTETPNTITINVFPTNHPPAGLAGALSKSISMLIGTTHTLSRTDFSFTDPADAPPNAFSGVVITSTPNPALLGSLTLGGAPIAAGQAVAIADIDAGKLVFAAPAVFANVSYTFKVKDDGGALQGGLDTDTTDRTLTFNVGQPLFSAPSGTSGTVTTLEDTNYTFGVTDFGFSDSDSPPNNFAAVRIASLPATGVLQENFGLVSVGQVIPVADLLVGNFRYIPPANANGTAFASFQFQVQDDGDISAGGQNLDPTPKTLTINVAAVKDPPRGKSFTVNPLLDGELLEDGAYTFRINDFGFSDLDDMPEDAFAAVRISSVPAKGTLELNRYPLDPNLNVSISDIDSGNLRYVPLPDENGTDYDRFTFQVIDSSFPDHGGSNIDPIPKTVTINVTPVNDPPAFTGGPDIAASDEDGPRLVLGWAKNLSTGPQDEAGQSLQFVVQANRSPGLFAAGPAIDVNGNMTFTPAPNASGSVQITVVLKDNVGTGNGGVDTSPPQTLTITVTKPRVWHNAANQLDVSADGIVAPGDALLVINYINGQGAGPVPQLAAASPPYLDVNGDGFVAPDDALMVINAINAAGTPVGPEGEAAAEPAVISDGDLLALLAQDLASQSKRRR